MSSSTVRTIKSAFGKLARSLSFAKFGADYLRIQGDILVYLSFVAYPRDRYVSQKHIDPSQCVAAFDIRYYLLCRSLYEMSHPGTVDASDLAFSQVDFPLKYFRLNGEDQVFGYDYIVGQHDLESTVLQAVEQDLLESERIIARVDSVDAFVDLVLTSGWSRRLAGPEFVWAVDVYAGAIDPAMCTLQDALDHGMMADHPIYVAYKELRANARSRATNVP